MLNTAGFLPNEPLTISSRDLPSNSVPLIAVVSVGHVSLMMLVVVIFQRFLGHMGRKGVVGIGQIGQREGHGVMSELMGDVVGLTGTLIEGSIGA